MHSKFIPMISVSSNHFIMWLLFSWGMFKERLSHRRSEERAEGKEGISIGLDGGNNMEGSAMGWVPVGWTGWTRTFQLWVSILLSGFLEPMVRTLTAELLNVIISSSFFHSPFKCVNFDMLCNHLASCFSFATTRCASRPWPPARVAEAALWLCGHRSSWIAQPCWNFAFLRSYFPLCRLSTQPQKSNFFFFFFGTAVSR